MKLSLKELPLVLVLVVVVMALTSCFKDIEYRTEEVRAIRIELFPMDWEADQYVFHFDNGKVINIPSFNIDFEPIEGGSYILKYERYVGGEKWTFVDISPLGEEI